MEECLSHVRTTDEKYEHSLVTKSDLSTEFFTNPFLMNIQ